MKKLSAILVALVLAAASVVTAFAAGINDNEQAVLDELGKSATMEGTEMYIPAEYVNQAESYFNTIEMTKEESDEIISVIESGIAFLEGSGASNIADLTYAQKQELLSYGEQAVGVIGMSMSYDFSDKTLTIYDPDGEVAFSSVPTLVALGSGSTSTGSGSSTQAVVSDGSIIKTTGISADFSGVAVVSVAFALVLAGSVLFVVRTKKERA